MKVAVVLLAVLSLLLAVPAWATTTDERLNTVATRFAQQPVEVLCYADGEAGAPADFGAWGYVYLHLPVIHLAPEVCEGAIAIANHDTTVPEWKRALGAVVLVHEAYHLALRYRDRGDEARTECRAIRHARYTMLFLGASPAEADTLMGFALALHWRLAAKVPEYHLKTCKVPNWYEPSSRPTGSLGGALEARY